MLCYVFVVVVLAKAVAGDEGPDIISRSADSSLPRWDPVKVGHERDVIQFQNAGERAAIARLKTVSVKPPVFRIDNFLSPAECDHLIMYAKRLGFKRSPLVRDPDSISDETSEKTFKQWDANGDGFIDSREVLVFPGKRDIYLTKKDVLSMFKELDMDQDQDGKISFEEFKKTGVPAIKEHFDKLRKIPRMRSRNSEQAWMFHDDPKYPLLADFHGRLSRLSGLPKYMVRNSEPVQVVKYGKDGHYHAHHDSDELDEEISCCSFYKEDNCRQCRYITVLFFLNEPEKGGETSFPFADNKTFTEKGLSWNSEKMNLAQNCQKSNLVVKPKKGTAVMWYNHYRNPKTGWLGELDQRTYHGGCDVTKGTKWIANVWLDVIGKANSEESFKGWLHSYQEEQSTDEESEDDSANGEKTETKEGSETKERKEAEDTSETKTSTDTKPEARSKGESEKNTDDESSNRREDL